LLTAIKAGSDYVDLEIETTENFKDDVIKAARDNGCKIIISYHNFGTTPHREELEEIVESCYYRGADIVKVACMVHSEAESARLVSLYEDFNGIISIGMGDKGKITRIAAPLFGAPFTYASFSYEKETAKGQISMDSLKNIYRELELVG